MNWLRRLDHRIILGFLLLVGFALRFHGIDKFGIAGDEKFSLFVSQFVTLEGNNQRDSVRKPDSPYFTAKEFWSEKDIDDFYDAIARIDTGNGAFFKYLLHWWTKIFGLSDLSLRFISLLFGVGLIFLTYRFTSVHFEDLQLALIVASLVTFSPLLISFSQVARNYSMLFFFALLSTHYFLSLLKALAKAQSWWLYALAYALTAAVCVLNHISSFTLFFFHFCFLLIYYRNLKSLLAFSLTMVLPVLAAAAWLLSPGGRYMFEYVGHSVDTYNQMAENNPYEFLSTATPSHILLQLRHVLANMFINIDGFYTMVDGKKLGIAALFAFVLAGFIYNGKLKTKFKHVLAVLLFSGITLLGFQNGPAVGIFTLNLGFLLLGSYLYITKQGFFASQNFTLIGIISTLPLLFLILFSLKDGNTFRIHTRYAAYAYVFCLLYVAIVYRYILGLNRSWTIWLKLAIAGQALLILVLIAQIYQDTQPRYFSEYTEPRTANPYNSLAEKIVEMAAPSDTVVYPSLTTYDHGQAMASVVDAQLTNFYLPKDNELWQRIDKNEPNKVYLYHADGRKTLLFDFMGEKYRFP
ncbi:glycosyltransferase family 39 protein [Marinilongibacter aquaticus]|uniref:glycosyltransferase family 39 protein n=1 Tax=Marinilongibacter aquaticus TaxID=2975157 RepID=UPI0021BDD245|nr:glycosyltransferase family 39 protein [Marinilongibacter aquaticus]UBM58581.1 glycosyltransferase family 39 protein [Marinilongibacter aquaticus]